MASYQAKSYFAFDFEIQLILNSKAAKSSVTWGAAPEARNETSERLKVRRELTKAFGLRNSKSGKWTCNWCLFLTRSLRLDFGWSYSSVALVGLDRSLLMCELSCRKGRGGFDHLRPFLDSGQYTVDSVMAYEVSAHQRRRNQWFAAWVFARFKRLMLRVIPAVVG